VGELRLPVPDYRSADLRIAGPSSAAATRTHLASAAPVEEHIVERRATSDGERAGQDGCVAKVRRFDARRRRQPVGEQPADRLREQAAESGGQRITGVDRYEVAVAQRLSEVRV